MSKMILRRMDQGTMTATAASGFADLLERALARALDCERLPGVAETARGIARRLIVLGAEMEATNEALERIRDLLHRHRRLRDKEAESFYDAVTDVRKLCRTFFGHAEADEFLGLRGRTPAEPKELFVETGRMVGRLADVEWPQPTVKLDAFTAKPQETARKFSKLRRELGHHLAAITEGEVQESVAAAANKRAKKAFELFHGKSSRYLEAALELAGLDELAAQIRPGAGRRGRPLKESTLDERRQLELVGESGAAGLLAEGDEPPGSPEALAEDGGDVRALPPGLSENDESGS